MYKFSSRVIGRETLSSKINIFSLSQYVKILCNVVVSSTTPIAKRLKVVIAAGLTSSHPEQRS